MIDYTSPFATPFPALPDIDGVRLSTASSGMKYKNRDDLMLVELAEGTTVAGVFTKNTMCGVPIDWGREILPNGKARALIVNSGIANVFTGEAGRKVLDETAKSVAKLFGCKKNEVYVSSTGVIGELPDAEKIIATLPKLQNTLEANLWENAASAIMTTDTFAKGISRTVKIGDTEVKINGIIKGSGMIQPNMATMLGYIFTDAKLPVAVLQEMLSEDVEHSYNCMTVDSDTSTSDTILVFATGKANNAEITDTSDSLLSDFRQTMREIHIELAKLVARDGEGITKFITVKAKGAKSWKAARKIARSIANSPLVKCAVAGGDPNWGRIVMAIGKSGEEANREKTSIWIGETLIAQNGAIHSDYDEKYTVEYMQGSEIDITVDVGVGNAETTIWTMDLTYDYIKINVDYRS